MMARHARGGSRSRLWFFVAAVLVSTAAWSMADRPVVGDDAIPRDAAARWWKGNLHTHTLWSDGDDFPEMVAEWYRTHGYHFLALSDHNVLAEGIRWMPEKTIAERGGPVVLEKYLARFGPSWVERRGEGDAAEVRLKPLDEFRSLVEERGRFLLIPAEEISDRVDGRPVHINASNIATAIQPVGGQTVSEAIQNNLRAIREQAERAGREILAHLNHPNFGYAVTAADLAHATLERHFEVYNGHPAVNQLGDAEHPGLDRLWDIANTIRLTNLGSDPLYGIATDDSHDYHAAPGAIEVASPGRGWVMVRATHLTPEKIIRAIQSGDCYASSGVTLREVRFDEASRTLSIEIEPDGDAHFTTCFVASFDASRIGEVVATVEGLSARYVATGNELYVRAIVNSSAAPTDPVWQGQRAQAWTQPAGWRRAGSTAR